MARGELEARPSPQTQAPEVATIVGSSAGIQPEATAAAAVAQLGRAGNGETRSPASLPAEGPDLGAGAVGAETAM